MATWIIDPTHSEVQFKVKHLVISTVTGSFTDYSSTVEGDDFTNAAISFSAKIGSISTGQEQRDGHLKSADFFDAENHPELTFVSTSATPTGDDSFVLNGDLTIRGTTLPVSLNVVYGGTMTDFYGNTKAGFEVSGKISRKAFGLSWDAVTEAGGVVVSDEVRISANVQYAKQA